MSTENVNAENDTEPTETASTRDEIEAIPTNARVEINYDPQSSAHPQQTRTGVVIERRDKKSGDFWKFTLETDGDEKYDVWVNGSVHKRESYPGYPDKTKKVGSNACVEEAEN